MMSTERLCEHGVRYDAICDACSSVLGSGTEHPIVLDLLKAVQSAVDSYCNCGAIRGVSQHRATCRSVSAELAETRFLAKCKEEGLDMALQPQNRLSNDLSYANGYSDGFRQGGQSRAVAFAAYNQAIEDAKSAIRGEKVDDPYAAATFINAIARKCSPHVYVNVVREEPL